MRVSNLRHADPIVAWVKIQVAGATVWSVIGHKSSVAALLLTCGPPRVTTSLPKPAKVSIFGPARTSNPQSLAHHLARLGASLSLNRVIGGDITRKDVLLLDPSQKWPLSLARTSRSGSRERLSKET
jgi:hypothetical protein